MVGQCSTRKRGLIRGRFFLRPISPFVLIQVIAHILAKIDLGSIHARRLNTDATERGLEVGRAIGLYDGQFGRARSFLIFMVVRFFGSDLWCGQCMSSRSNSFSSRMTATFIWQSAWVWVQALNALINMFHVKHTKRQT